jgi:hypothetical protein
MIVHHVEMNHVCACGDDGADFFTQFGEVGGQDGGGDFVSARQSSPRFEI